MSEKSIDTILFPEVLVNARCLLFPMAQGNTSSESTVGYSSFLSPSCDGERNEA